MQNVIIVLGAIVGMFFGGLVGSYLLHDSGDVGLGVSLLSGAIPGTVVGGWIGLKLLERSV